MRLCTIPTCLAPSSVQQKFQFFRLWKYFPNRKYPRVEIMELFPTAPCCCPARYRVDGSDFVDCCDLGNCDVPGTFKPQTLHNYRACRKRSTSSLGRYRSGVPD